MTTTNVDLGKHGSFHLHKGALHRALGVPEGDKIPASKMAQASHSSNPHVRHMAASAHGLAHMGKGGGKPKGSRRSFGGQVFD